MGKFNINTNQSGMLSELEQVAQPDLPIAPQSGGSAVADLMSGQEAPPVALSAPETAPVVEEDVSLQEDRDRVPTVKERSQGLVAPVKWDQRRGKPTVASSDGGVQERAENMVAAFEHNNAWGGGLGLTAGALSDTMATLGAITQQDKIEKPDGSLGFNTQLDPAFLMIGSAVTENMITRLAQGQTPVESFQREKIKELEQEKDPATAKNEFGKATGNTEIGTEIARDYMRFKNAQAGLPTDQYSDIAPEQAALLGDAFKEMYAIANPNYLQRVEPELGGHVTFQLTPEGAQRLNDPMAKLKRGMMFPGVNVRPSKSPIGGQLQSEVGRVATRKRSGKVKGVPAGADVIEEAAKNLSTVPNVVDKKRMKILFLATLPALRGDPEGDLGRDINGLGAKQVAKFEAAKKKADREGAEYSVEDNMAALENSLAQQVRAVAMERNGANYLSYYVQSFNGRIAPQQSFFDPTSSKAVRFVTRNAVPAKATPGSRVDKNLRQMYAMMLVKGADSLLPDGREQALTRDTAKLRQWGNKLNEALENSMSDADAEAIAEAIAEGMALTDPNFPQFNAIPLDPEADADLIKAIRDKGEDGMHFIDGLIDFANYIEARDMGRPHHSYFNAYMDGKTNGIASNGIQMGSRDVAFKTGVMRTNPDTLLDDDMDIRDALMQSLTEELDTTGLQAKDPNLYTVMRSVYNYRQLAKDTTMTYGYGKEMESFRADISEALDILLAEDAANPEGGELTAAMDILMQDGDRDSVIDTMWSNYTNHLGGALSQEALETRPIMRAAATWHALLDQVFAINTATGFELNLGGEVAQGELAAGYSETGYSIHEGGKKRAVTSQRFTTRSTAAAAKGDQGPGSRAYGGSLPGPVQSLDAAAVALTSSGRSWNRLANASSGNPYLHTIYDAFKVDAMGYDVVLDEVNKNWLDASMDWSYLEATLEATEKATKKFQEDHKHYPDALPIDTSPTGEYLMFGWMANEFEHPDTGEVGPWNLIKQIRRTADRPLNTNEEQKIRWLAQTKKQGFDFINQMKKQGFNPNQPTMGDLKNFLKMYGMTINLRGRLNKMINHTNKKKKDLRNEIKKAGLPVYQYYAH